MQRGVKRTRDEDRGWRHHLERPIRLARCAERWRATWKIGRASTAASPPARHLCLMNVSSQSRRSSVASISWLSRGTWGKRSSDGPIESKIARRCAYVTLTPGRTGARTTAEDQHRSDAGRRVGDPLDGRPIRSGSRLAAEDFWMRPRRWWHEGAPCSRRQSTARWESQRVFDKDLTGPPAPVHGAPEAPASPVRW